MWSTPFIALRTPWLVIRLHVDRVGPASEAPQQAVFVGADREEGLRMLTQMGLCDMSPSRGRRDELGLLEPSPGPAGADFAGRPWM
jgi:hypothetical protein